MNKMVFVLTVLRKSTLSKWDIKKNLLSIYIATNNFIQLCHVWTGWHKTISKFESYKLANYGGNETRLINYVD